MSMKDQINEKQKNQTLVRIVKQQEKKLTKIQRFLERMKAIFDKK